MDREDAAFGAPRLEAGGRAAALGGPRRGGGGRAGRGDVDREERVHRAERSGGDDYDELLRLDESVPKRGLSLAAIRALPRRAVRPGERVEDLITRSLVAPGAVVYDLPCGHCFEKPALLAWFRDHRTCPVCRHEVEA